MEFVHLDNDDLPFDSQEIETVQQTIIKNINSHLNKTRYDGLLMLDRILPTCSKDVLSKYGLFWITNATKVVENVHSSTQDLTLACKVLGFLIELCKNIPELHKQISTRNVKQIINILSALQIDAKCGAVYYLIAVLLYHYPEVCERFQGLIQKMILLQIDSTDDNLVNASAKCYVLLSKATERSFKSSEPTFIYTRLIYNEMLLCNSLHVIMNKLFYQLLELESIDIQNQLELPYITDNIHNYNKQKQRFSNLCIYLSSMLRGYEARNIVLPQNILKVLHRGLTITPLNLKNKTSPNERMLYIILPKLHISLLTVFDALINGFAQELIPFGTKILELFQGILQWTSIDLENQITFSNSKPFKSVKIQAYKCLCSWLMNTSSLSGIETIANECISSILKDIIPERDRILLTMHQKTQQLSKRAIKRFKQSQYENSTVMNNGKDSIKSGRLDPDLCREALITLQNIFSSGTILLKEMLYKNVLNTVIPLLYNFYLNSSEQSFYKDNNKCRLELFKVLKALQMNPHITLAFPIQYCLEISHMAAHDIDVNIVQEATLALAELEKIIHPAAPTLQLPRQEKSDNEFVSESQAEEIATTNKSDKRSRTEEELSQNVDATLSASKRPKIISSKCVEIIQNRNGIELIEVNNSILNVDKSQMKQNSCKDIISISNENDRTEEKLSKDTDMDHSKISFIERQTCKLLNTITASKCTGKLPSVNTTKPIETNNSIMDVDESRANENLCEVEETENILQEQYKVHHSKKENQHNINKIINSTIENKIECELITHVNTEEKQLKENLTLYTNKTDKRIEEMSPQKYSGTEEEICVEMDDSKNQDELNISTRNSPNIFEEEPSWHN
ncbi:proline-, glutamic acid- and leucine-rich protein 1 [Polyergus mexicanus]|uniref:proline-, glutamic acid- and leucine-rich protein 1 n=1 Tax=Polyergus mexicanus TaxID=615972 RepID=UPI0038B5157A